MTVGEFRKLLKTANADMDISSLIPQKEIFIPITQETPTLKKIEEGYMPLFKHSVNPGDLIAAMGAIKKYYDVLKENDGVPPRIIVAQTLNVKAAYYSGAIHPTLDESGNAVTCNLKMWEMLKPLIESQEYIHAFVKYEGQRVDVDFDVIRGKTNINMPHGPIQGWIPLAYPDLSFDMSKSWITLKDKCPEHIRKQVNRKVIVNFTERYRAPMLDYYFLKNYAPDLIFAGTEREYFLFTNAWGISCPRLHVENFLELAHALKASRFVLANQSLCWNLCQAMLVPRVLEMCHFADNCFPMIGEDSHGYFYQVGAEHDFRIMYNKTS